MKNMNLLSGFGYFIKACLCLIWVEDVIYKYIVICVDI